MPKSNGYDKFMEFITEEAEDEIIQITEYKVKPLHYIFGVVDLTKTTKT